MNSSNITEVTSVTDEDESLQTDWKYDPPAMKPEIASILQAMALLLSLYILASLIVFEKRRKSKSCLKTLAKKSMSFAGARRHMASGKLLRYLCITGAVCCSLSCLNDLIFYNLEYNTDVGCTAMQIIGVSLLIGLDTTVYIFLWIRQYVTCRRFLLRNRVLFIILSVIKWSVLFLIISMAAVMDCLLIIYRRHYFNETFGTCEQLDVNSPANKAITHLWMAGSVSLQILLVFLFAFPLLQQYSKSPQHQNGNPAHKHNNSLPAINRARILALVQRCIIIATLCIATDIGTMLITEYIFTGPSNRQLRALLYNLNIIFNLIAIIRSFKDWKSMLTFGMFNGKNKSRQSSNDGAALAQCDEAMT